MILDIIPPEICQKHDTINSAIQSQSKLQHFLRGFEKEELTEVNLQV